MLIIVAPQKSQETQEAQKSKRTKKPAIMSLFHIVLPLDYLVFS